MNTPTDLQDAGARPANPYDAFDRLVELARPSLGLTDKDIETLTANGPAEALDRLAALMAAHGIATAKAAAPVPQPEPVLPQTKQQQSAPVPPETIARARQNWLRGAVRPRWRKTTRGQLDRSIYPIGGFNLVIRV